MSVNWSKTLGVALASVLVLTAAYVAQADVVGYWRFDGDPSDSSGGEHHGTASGSGHAYESGRLGQALRLDGSGYISVADDPVWDTGNAVTVSTWFRTTEGQYGKGLLTHDFDYRYMNYLSGNSSALIFYVRTTDSTTVKSAMHDGGTWDDDQWHHMVGVYDRYAANDERVKVYVDGQLRGNTTGADAPITPGHNGLRIGAWGDGFVGLLDDVAIFDHPLSTAEVAHLYNGGNGRMVNGNVYWSGTTGNWTEGAKWSVQREPYNVEVTNVNNGGTVTVSGDEECGRLCVGYGVGTSGTLRIAGGSLTQTGTGHDDDLIVGQEGHGEVHQSGGNVYTTHRLRVGEGGKGHGLYEIGGGALNVGSPTSPYTTYVGSHGGHGEIRQTGGEVSLSNTAYIGVWNATSTGIYRLKDGDLIVNGTLIVSHNGTGEFYQSGGNVSVTSDLQLGYGNTGAGSGLYEISDGTLNVDGRLDVGVKAPGRLHIIGDEATINVHGYTQTAASMLELDMNSITTINVEGSVTLAGDLDIEFLTAPTAGMWFPIILNDESDPVHGTFAGKPDGATFLALGSDLALQISYGANFDGGSVGNDVGILVTPEPTSLALFGIGALGLLRRRRRLVCSC